MVKRIPLNVDTAAYVFDRQILFHMDTDFPFAYGKVFFLNFVNA